MKTKLGKILLIGIVIVIIIVVFVWKWTFRAAETSVANKKTDVSIQADALLKAYTSNEDSTNALYLNKILAVKGIVDNISEKDQEISVYLKKKEDMSGVMCGFYKNELDKSSLKPGQEITVKGYCTGFLMDVVLTKCSLVK